MSPLTEMTRLTRKAGESGRGSSFVLRDDRTVSAIQRHLFTTSGVQLGIAAAWSPVLRVGAVRNFDSRPGAPRSLRGVIGNWSEGSPTGDGVGRSRAVPSAAVSASIVIRPVAEDDLERLDNAYPEPGRPASRHAERWDLQEREEGVYLVAWQGDHPIGRVFVYRQGSREASPQARQLDAAEILDLLVDPRFQGHGYGSALLLAAEQLARDAGWTLVGLEVTVSNPHNDVARAMYEHHGYRDSKLGEYGSGYFYWTETGERRWDGEPHRFLIKSLGSS